MRNHHVLVMHVNVDRLIVTMMNGTNRTDLDEDGNNPLRIHGTKVQQVQAVKARRHVMSVRGKRKNHVVPGGRSVGHHVDDPGDPLGIGIDDERTRGTRRMIMSEFVFFMTACLVKTLF